MRDALAPLLDEVAARQAAVVRSGRYILGPEVEAFESEFASHLGRDHCVGVANGTEALTIALRALDVGPGDEVVVPGYSFFATAEAVVNAGARPVFCDIDPQTGCMTAATAEPAITPGTRALLPVHIFGNPAPMGELVELAEGRGIAVVEDAAQAAGARLAGRPAGTHGDAATFSFYPGKNLGATGDAGAIVTDSAGLAERARALRNHGQRGRWIHDDVGYNSRLDELQAAALRVFLPHLGGWTAARRQVAARYRESGLGESVELPRETAQAEAAYHLYVACTPRRDELAESLAAAGIESRAYYTPALHRQRSMLPFGPPESLPNSERLAAQGLALPMGQSLGADAVASVADAVRRALAA